jgi:predicted HTH transcriptional regulator
MILSTLRMMQTNRFKTPLICSDTDFQTALEMVKILVQHAARLYEALPAEPATPKQPNQKQQFLEALSPEFSRQEYLKIAQTLNIPDKTAEKHIAKFVQSGLINHFAHDKYYKQD